MMSAPVEGSGEPAAAWTRPLGLAGVAAEPVLALGSAASGAEAVLEGPLAAAVGWAGVGLGVALGLGFGVGVASA